MWAAGSKQVSEPSPVWQVKLIHCITARLPSDSLALLPDAFVALAPFLQAQAPTPPPVSTWQRPPPGPTCPGRPAMTEASSRHSQSGTALCESSQHALLPAFFFFQCIICCYWKCLFQGCVQNSCESKDMENTWMSRVCEFASPTVVFFCQKTSPPKKQLQLNWTWPRVFFPAAATALLLLGWGTKQSFIHFSYLECCSHDKHKV